MLDFLESPIIAGERASGHGRRDLSRKDVGWLQS